MHAWTSPHTFRGGDGWSIMFEVSHCGLGVPATDPPRCQFPQVGGHDRRSNETHRVFLYERSEIGQALRASGFRVQVLEGYGILRLREEHFGFFAEKL